MGPRIQVARATPEDETRRDSSINAFQPNCRTFGLGGLQNQLEQVCLIDIVRSRRTSQCRCGRCAERLADFSEKVGSDRHELDRLAIR